MVPSFPLPTGVLLAAMIGAVPPTAGADLTASRVASLPAAEAAVWEEYLARSRAAANRDQHHLETELATAGIARALPAPSGGDFKLPKPSTPAWYGGGEGSALVDAVISFQTPSGGWSKHTGYSKGSRRLGMQWSSQSKPGAKPHYLGTIDNGATTREIRFLAAAWVATRRDDCRAAVERGIDYLLAAQFPSGGWPQVYPLEGGYHDSITFNDDAMTNVLELFRDVTGDSAAFAGVSAERRRLVAAALDRGVKCALACQFRQRDRKTGWCGQHDPITLAPAPARAYEPSALAAVESSHVLRFLMSLPRPSAEIVAAIEAGLAWLEAVQLTGSATIRQGGRTASVADDKSDAGSWARFYDLTTGRPIFPGKNGVVYSTYEEMAAANDTLGYDYLSTRPGSILRTGQAKWRKRMKSDPAS